MSGLEDVPGTVHIRGEYVRLLVKGKRRGAVHENVNTGHVAVHRSLVPHVNDVMLYYILHVRVGEGLDVQGHHLMPFGDQFPYKVDAQEA